MALSVFAEGIALCTCVTQSNNSARQQAFVKMTGPGCGFVMIFLVKTPWKPIKSPANKSNVS